MERARPLSVSPAGGGGLARPPAAPPAQASSAFQAVADPTLAGDSQNGAIFFSLGHGEGFARCSGTSVNAPNLSVVFTAGHCVDEGGPQGRWYSHKWVFVPGYHNGERPFGVFVAKWLGATRQWLAHGNENFDVGAAVVSPNEGGQQLATAAGADGIAWGLSPNQVFDVYGYPVAPPFNGATLQLCHQTAYEGHDFASFLWPGPLNLAVQCDVTGGASGGGWTIAGGILNGVTTYGYPADPKTDFGPYFGKAVGGLFARAARVK
jgi:V8-like Glu-specific endopeptidase